MKTELESIVEYLAGRRGDASARLRVELDDPSSEASRFLDAARRRTRALIEDPSTDGLPLPRSTRPILARRAAMAALAASILALAAFGAWTTFDARARRAEALRALVEARAEDQARRVEAALARAGEAHPTALPIGRPAEPIALALARVEDGLARMGQRLDGLSARPSTPDGPTAPPPPSGPDPSIAEIRAELAAIRRESAASEQATARQIQEMRSILQEVNLVVRRSLMTRPQGNTNQGPVPILIPGLNGVGGGNGGVDEARVMTLMAGLNSPHAHHRLEAIEQLGRLGPAARVTLPNLRQMMNHSHEADARVRAAAQAAVNALGNE